MRIAARLVIVLCALGSLACTLYAGHNNRSMLLVLLFAVWVLAPFLALLMLLPRWERALLPRAPLLQTCVMIFCIAVCFVYAMNAWHPHGHSAAAPFLLGPMFSWSAIVCGFLFVRSQR